MKLEEKIASLSEYGLGFRTYENNYIIYITYKDDWAVIQPSDEEIKFMRDDKNPNTYYYVTKIGDVSKFQGIFDTIDETIIYNKEIEEKNTLFKEKTEELFQLFIDKPISELKKLQFTFPPQKKNGKKQNRIKSAKKTEEKQTERKQVEEKNEEDDLNEIDNKIMVAIEKVNKQKDNMVK